MKYKFLAALMVIVGFSILFFYREYQKASDGRLHIIFCDVGQGDGIVIKTPAGSTIIYDGGPNDLILSCLSNHMPFWQRTLSFVALSHPHADHLIGLIDVLKRYTTLHFVTEKLENKIAPFEALQSEISTKHISKRYLYFGDHIKTKDNVLFSILAPTQEFLEASSPGNSIGESKEFANLITLLSYGSFSLLLPGDSQAPQLLKTIQESGVNPQVIQVPHHGSATGLSKEIFEFIHPKIGVISVGAKNHYGHPASSTLKILRDQDIKILRTDKNGEIEIISDGKTWTVLKAVGSL